MFLFTDRARSGLHLCRVPESLDPILCPDPLFPVPTWRGSWSSLPVVVEGGEPLHLELELVESQGELLCFCVE